MISAAESHMVKQVKSKLENAMQQFPSGINKVF